jgi:hypothetical protein
MTNYAEVPHDRIIDLPDSIEMDAGEDSEIAMTLEFQAMFSL